MDMIKRVGAVIVRDGKLLVLKKKGLDIYISPGGKPEAGETPEQTLKRELKEELGVGVRDATVFGTFRAESVIEGVPVETLFFLTDIDGNPSPQGEIEGMAWIGREAGIPIAPLMKKYIVPELIEKGVL